MGVPNRIVTEHEVANGGVLGQVQRDRVVRASTRRQRCSVSSPRARAALTVAQPSQGDGEGSRGREGGNVVRADLRWPPVKQLFTDGWLAWMSP